jgi:hypothetical protein
VAIDEAEWSPSALKVCLICDLLWGLVVISGCAYVVFLLDQPGWWFLFALLLAGAGVNCEKYRSPAQIREAAAGERENAERG